MFKDGWVSYNRVGFDSPYDPAVDVIDHERGKVLSHEAYARVFGDILADEFMVLLNAAFLLGSHGVAIIQGRTPGACRGVFQRVCMLEFRPIVRKDKGEYLPENT